jgi:hypothetical protein
MKDSMFGARAYIYDLMGDSLSSVLNGWSAAKVGASITITRDRQDVVSTSAFFADSSRGRAPTGHLAGEG